MFSEPLQTAIKVLFTGVLLLIIALCGVEIWRLWFDRTLVLVSFGYIRNGEPVPEAGQHFTRLVSQDLIRLRNVYSGMLSSGDVHIPSTDHLGRGEDFPLPELRESVFSSVEIEAYGIQLSTMLRAISRWIERPNAIVGSVSESSRGIDVYAELQNVSSDVSAKMDQHPWYIPQKKDINDASFALACRIFRLLSASQSPFYAEVSDPEFYAFTRALLSYQLYRERLKAVEGEEEIKKSLAEASQLISVLSNRDSRFPFVHKLAGYIYLEEGNIEDAEKALTRYLDLLKEHRETDKAAEELSSALRGEKPPAEVKVAKTAEDLKLRDRIRPVQPGTSVSGPHGTGTICCIVRDAGGQKYLLSADHVFHGDIGDPIIQPGDLDGGQPSDQIAEIARKIVPQPDKVNRVGAAIARLSQGGEVSPEIPGVGRIRGIATTIQPGEVLRIVGRTAGLAEGKVQRINVKIQIHSPEPTAFEGLIETTNMSSAGDSGAPVLTTDGELVGIVYAGSSSSTLVMPIESILQELDVYLVQ